ALRDAIILHDGVPRTKHVITNLTIEVDEAAGTATARSYFTVLQATAGLPRHAIPHAAPRPPPRTSRASGRPRVSRPRRSSPAATAIVSRAAPAAGTSSSGASSS